MDTPAQSPQFAICIHTHDTDLLTPRMIYRVLPDENAARSNYIRIIDNEGEDYLYPAEYFVMVDLSPALSNQLLSLFGTIEYLPDYDYKIQRQKQ